MRSRRWASRPSGSRSWSPWRPARSWAGGRGVVCDGRWPTSTLAKPGACAERQRFERQALLRESDIQAREQALAIRAEAEAALRAREAELAEGEIALAAQAVRIDEEVRLVAEARDRLKEREAPVAEREQDARAFAEEVRSIEASRQGELERGGVSIRG